MPHTLLDAELHVGDAVLRPGVVVRVERDTRLLRGGDDRLVDRVGVVAARDRHDAVARGRIAAFDALEHGPHVVPRPAVGAAVGPVVVVLARAAHPDHGVQTARAAEHAPARPAEPPIRRVALRHGLVRPVDLTQPQLMQAPGVVDGGVDVRAAGLEQEHPRSAVDQPPRGRGARRAGADDDDVGVKAGRVGVGDRLSSRVGHDFSGSGTLSRNVASVHQHVGPQDHSRPRKPRGRRGGRNVALHRRHAHVVTRTGRWAGRGSRSATRCAAGRRRTR